MQFLKDFCIGLVSVLAAIGGFAVLTPFVLIAGALCAVVWLFLAIVGLVVFCLLAVVGIVVFCLAAAIAPVCAVFGFGK